VPAVFDTEVHIPNASEFVSGHSQNEIQSRRCMTAILPFEIITKTLKISIFFLDLLPPKYTDKFY
jgi:hypothetical protein